MAVTFAVFTYEELLTVDKDPNEVLKYLGAIEKFSGIQLERLTLHWVRLATSSQPGYLITLDGNWLDSDRMHLIMRDAINEDAFAEANVDRLTECTSRAMGLALPKNTTDINFYMVSRNDRPERACGVTDWACDVEQVRNWIIECDRTTHYKH